MDTRKPYPTNVSDEEWKFVAPYLTLIDEQSPQRHHDPRELFNALCWLVRAGAPMAPAADQFTTLASGLLTDPALVEGLCSKIPFCYLCPGSACFSRRSNQHGHKIFSNHV